MKLDKYTKAHWIVYFYANLRLQIHDSHINVIQVSVGDIT